MTSEETLSINNNLDVRWALRRFAPQWSIVFVNKTGDIVDVVRFKEWPKSGVLPPEMQQHPGTMKFLAQPGMFTTIDQLRKRVIDCVWTHDNASRINL